MYIYVYIHLKCEPYHQPKNNPPPKKNSANGIYYFIDMIELLSIFEILPYQAAEVKRIRYRVWTLKVIFSLCLIVLAVSKNKKAMKKVGCTVWQVLARI